jgi:sialic acid synthase
MSREIILDGTRVADDTDSWVIAEIGHNHQGKLEQCKALFKAAKEAGASAVKLQKRDNKTLFTKAMYERAYDSENAFAPTYGAHREALEFGRAEYLELQRYATELGITFFSTAFDHNSADFLNELGMPLFKMASGDLTNTPLLKHVAKMGKPMIVSTGGGTMDDVKRAHDTIMPINRQLVLLQCTAGYPPAWDELNLRVIETFRNTFPEVVVGLSSHDSGIAMALVGYMLGSRVVEKHFTLNRAMRGTDHAFSLEPVGLRKLCRDLHRARIALGDGVKRTYDSEKAPLQKMGKKLVAARDLPAGTVLSEADIAFKSPADGLPPHAIDRFIGRKLARAVTIDATLSLADIGA